ncbi:hypothetical protein HID58_086652 [Brassica napus]|uniref:Uncharacterized protein n=1 Tax=Brassica napus TaxID=3708 RepID=A0ABQ7XR34_BRANA|nr:hypothetical protein HID58_086652 [Brassica napus]
MLTVRNALASVQNREFSDKAKVWDSEKIVVIPDHYIFTADKRANRNVDIMRDYCREKNVVVIKVWWLILITKVFAMLRLHKKVIEGQKR